MAQCIAVNDREIKFYVPNSGNETKLRDNFSNAFRFLLESTAALRGTVSVHACAVVKDGKAYAFVGNSGAGKSTHGLQWVNHLGAEMISGDRSLIQCKDGEAIIHGVPWDGKEQLFRQVSYPLHGVVEIRKSSQNTMCRLSAAKARRSLPGQFVLPAWDANAFAYGFSTIMSLARIVPCFRLFCTPDEQGARRCYDGIMNRELLPVTDDPDIVAVDERFYEDSNDAIPRRIMRADQCGLLKQLELPVTVAKAWQLLKNPVSKRELTAEMAIGADKSFEQIEREATQAVCWLKEHALVE